MKLPTSNDNAILVVRNLSLISRAIECADMPSFTIEAHDVDIMAKRINRWQYDVTSETSSGRINTDYAMGHNAVMDFIKSVAVMDANCVFRSHLPA